MTEPRTRFNEPLDLRNMMYCRCPKCGAIDDLDGWDVLGMGDGEMACNECGAIVRPILVEASEESEVKE